MGTFNDLRLLSEGFTPEEVDFWGSELLQEGAIKDAVKKARKKVSDKAAAVSMDADNLKIIGHDNIKQYNKDLAEAKKLAKAGKKKEALKLVDWVIKAYKGELDSSTAASTKDGITFNNKTLRKAVSSRYAKKLAEARSVRAQITDSK